MTTIITPMGLPWPAEWADPYIDEITLTQGSIDAIREDADLMLVGGGDLTLVADLFSWSAPIYLYSTRTGYYATIASGSLTVLDGHSIYFNPVSRPMPTAAVSLLSAASIPPASIMMGVRRGSTVVIRNRGIAVVNLTLDDAYNNDGGAATIDVDAGDVSWDVTGAYSFIIDLTAATGDVDGFIVQNVVPPNGVSSSFRVTKNTTNDVVDLWARVGDAHIEASTGLVLQSNGTTDITFNARSNTKTLSDVSNATFTGSISAETSIYGALNSLAAVAGLTTLDDAYNNDSGAADIIVDAGDLIWDITGAYSFIVDLAAVTGDIDGFKVQSGSYYFNVIKVTSGPSDVLNVNSILHDFIVVSDGEIRLTCTTPTEDIRFVARGGDKTLNDVSNTTFTGSISAATSIFGALNILGAGGASTTTLDDAYNNDGGAATIDVDAGDVSWDVTGAYSFIIDLTAATGDVDGFIVQNVVPPNGVSSSFRVTKNTTNDVVDLWARVGDAHIEASTGLVLQSNGTTDITFNARSNTKTLSDVSNATFTGSISAETSIYGALNSLAASGGSSVYGSEHVANESEGVSSTSSTTWQTKLTLTTPSLPSGEYIVEYQFEFYDDEGEFGDVQVLHEAAVIAFSQFTGRDAFDEDYSLHSGFFILDSISGVQNFYIQYRGDGTLDNLFIRRARLRLYRLS